MLFKPMPVTATAAAVTPIPGAASIVVRPSFPIHAQQRPPPIEPVHPYGKYVLTLYALYNNNRPTYERIYYVGLYQIFRLLFE